MILDALTHLDLYQPLSTHIARAITFIRTTSIESLANGRHEIDGDHVFGVVHAYQTSQEGVGRWESHRRYIDLQIVLEGAERMLVTDTTQLVNATPFDSGKDVQFYERALRHQSVTLEPGLFALLFPHDGHRATLAIDAAVAVRKLVVKIEVA